MKSRWIIILAIIFGFLTTYLVYDYLTDMRDKINNVDYVKQVVALKDIPPFTKITSNMVIEKEVPKEYIHSAIASKLEDVVGKITNAPIVMGEPIFNGRIVEPGDHNNGLAFTVPEGKRAVTVAINEVSGIAGLLKPHDKVDIIAIMAFPKAGSATEKEYVTDVVLQNIEILAVGKIMKAPPEGLTGEGTGTLTLAVTLNEAQRMLMASHIGELRMALRLPIDNTVVETVPIKVQNLMR